MRCLEYVMMAGLRKKTEKEGQRRSRPRRTLRLSRPRLSPGPEAKPSLSPLNPLNPLSLVGSSRVTQLCMCVVRARISLAWTRCHWEASIGLSGQAWPRCHDRPSGGALPRCDASVVQVRHLNQLGPADGGGVEDCPAARVGRVGRSRLPTS